MRISDWSSDVCSSDLLAHPLLAHAERFAELLQGRAVVAEAAGADDGLLALAQLEQGLLDPFVARQAVVEGDHQILRAEALVGQLVLPLGLAVLSDAGVQRLVGQDRKSTRLNSSH